MSSVVYIYDRDLAGAEFSIRKQYAAEVGDDEAKRMSNRSRGRFLVVIDSAHLGRNPGEPFFCHDHDSAMEMAFAICASAEQGKFDGGITLRHWVADDVKPTIAELIDELGSICQANAEVLSLPSAND